MSDRHILMHVLHALRYALKYQTGANVKQLLVILGKLQQPTSCMQPHVVGQYAKGEQASSSCSHASPIGFMPLMLSNAQVQAYCNAHSENLQCQSVTATLVSQTVSGLYCNQVVPSRCLTMTSQSVCDSKSCFCKSHAEVPTCFHLSGSLMPCVPLRVRILSEPQS